MEVCPLPLSISSREPGFQVGGMVCSQVWLVDSLHLSVICFSTILSIVCLVLCCRYGTVLFYFEHKSASLRFEPLVLLLSVTYVLFFALSPPPTHTHTLLLTGDIGPKQVVG